MEKLLYTYALTKAIYDIEGNYIDTFRPFVVNTLSSDIFQNCPDIQQKVIDQYSIKIPLHVLKSILFRANKKKLVSIYKEEYKLSKTGQKYQAEFDSEKVVERRINALLVDLVSFFAIHNIDTHVEEIDDLILYFINKNIELLREWLISTNLNMSPDQVPVLPTLDGNEGILVEYIMLVEHEKPEHYKTLQDMVLGSIISIILHVQKASDLNNFRTREFQTCEIFLDTSFVISALGLDPPEYSEPARELFDLLKDWTFDKIRGTASK
jgi:hypothetical protein